VGKRRGIALGSRLFSAVVATLLIGGGVVAVASLLFQQNFSEVPVVPGLTTACAGTASLTANATQIIAGASGYVRYTCGTGPAFSALAGATAVPTFSLAGTPYTKLYIFAHSTPTGTTCLGGDSSTQITNGQRVTFPLDTGTTWDYCGRFIEAALDAGTIFNVTWSA